MTRCKYLAFASWILLLLSSLAERASTVPTHTSISLFKKRLDALTEQLDDHKLRFGNLEADLSSGHDTKISNRRSDYNGLLT